jgi:hypothetical protein
VVEEPDPPADRNPATFDDAGPRSQRDVAAEWSVFLETLHADRPSLSSFLAHAKITAWTGASLDLQFAHSLKFQFDELTRPANRVIIEQHLERFAGCPVQLHLTLETSPVAGEQQHLQGHVRGPASAALEDEIRTEPIIQNVLDVFDGEVIE